jgi:hypothetical protein
LEADDFQGRARIHPSRAPGQRVELIFPSLASLNREERQGLEGIDKDASKDFWCHSFGRRIPSSGAVLTGQTATTATYSFKPVPDASDKDDVKLMRNLRGTVTVAKDRPAILSFALTAPKSFKPVMVARVDTFSMTARCARTSDGRTYVSTFNLRVTGSAMLQSFEQKQSRRHTQLRRVGA